MPPEKPQRKEPPKLRINQELYDEVDAVADAGRHQGLTRVGIVEEAVRRELRRRKLGEEWADRDPALTPMNTEEETVVRAALSALRQPFDRAEQSALKLLLELFANRAKVAGKDAK